jgi:uncharacterized Zn finger protein
VTSVARSLNKGDCKHVVALVVEASFERFWQLVKDRITNLRDGLDCSGDSNTAEILKVCFDQLKHVKYESSADNA